MALQRLTVWYRRAMSDDIMKPSRREVLLSAVGVLGAVLVSGCDDGSTGTDAGPGTGSDAGGSTDSGPLVCNTVGWEMGNRHPPGSRHSIDVPIAHLTAGTEQTYDIQGESRHPHTVVVTPAQFDRIAAGERVVITSSEDMGVDLHTHDVTLFCSA